MFECEVGDSLQGMFLQLTHGYFHKIYHQVSNLGLYPGQVPILYVLYKHEGLSQRELAGLLNIKPPTDVVTIRRMEKAGFVKRCQDEADQRVSRIHLTDKGKESFLQVKKIMQENEKVVFSDFSESEICLIRRFFKQMKGNIEKISVEEKGGTTC